MNPSHYPSLELCRKLTEAGFPEETSCHFRRNNSDIYEHTFWPWDDASYVCPSVMELLDEMPDTIAQEYLLHFWKNNDRQYWVSYQEVEWKHWLWECGKWFETLPNALAEMWLWLVENGYINKTK